MSKAFADASDFVNAPIINEFPMTVECELLKFNEDGICIGKIINISAIICFILSFLSLF